MCGIMYFQGWQFNPFSKYPPLPYTRLIHCFYQCCKHHSDSVFLLPAVAPLPSIHLFPYQQIFCLWNFTLNLQNRRRLTGSSILCVRSLRLVNCHSSKADCACALLWWIWLSTAVWVDSSAVTLPGWFYTFHASGLVCRLPISFLYMKFLTKTWHEKCSCLKHT